MDKDKSSEIEVIIDDRASDDEVDAVREVFTTAGLHVDTSYRYGRKAVGELPWIVLILPAGAFLTALGAAAGKDAYDVLKRLVRDIWSVRKRFSGPQGHVLLRDDDTRVEVILEPDLPDEAYKKLCSLDLSSFKTGPLRYDRQVGEWRRPSMGK